MEWRFAKMDRNESRDRSCLAEFFNDSKIFKDFTDALVREDIQNRLDAKRADAADSDPVIVTYRLTTHDARAAAKIKKWLVALAPHCNSNSCRETYHRKPLTCFYESNPTFHCLTIEDFTTTGLQGDPAEIDETHESIKTNDFYWMFRNLGRSGKARLPGKRGSWGVGKVVYHLASQINTMFCYSITKNGFGLMGKCQLEPHDIGGQMYRSVGYFGNYAEDGFCMPESNIENTDVQAFKQDFSIERRPDELGTSTVIPFCNEDITVQSLVCSVIRSYLWEILNGHLVVRIKGDDGEEIRLTADPKKLFEYIKQYFQPSENDNQDEQFKYIVFDALYSKIVANQRSGEPFSRYMLKEPENCRLVSNYKDLFESPEKFDEAQSDFLGEKIVEVDANITIEKCAGSGFQRLPADFRVFLWRKGFVPMISLIRDGLTILKLKSHNQTAFCGLTLIEGGADGQGNPLSDFLRAAENPSHTELNPSRDAFRGQYNVRGSKMLLDYITELVWNLAAAFSDMNGKTDESALDDWFPMDSEDSADGELGPDGGSGIPDGGENSTNKPKKRHKRKVKPVVPPIPRKKSFFRVADWNQGVKVVPSETPASAEDLPWNLQLKLAFAAEGVAAPLKKYDLSDFDCREGGQIAFNLDGAKAIKREPNRVVFEVSRPDFNIELTGFGENRCDIYVEASKIKSSEVAEGTPDENQSKNDDDSSEEDSTDVVAAVTETEVSA